MATKGRKKRGSKDSTSSNAGSGDGEGGDKKKKEGGKKKSSSSKSIGCDIFNDAAMDNAYYVCHNVQVRACLSSRWLFSVYAWQQQKYLFIFKTDMTNATIFVFNLLFYKHRMS